jgi:hypothetical protein
VEISEDAAAESLLALHRVIVGDIERPDVLAMLDEALGGSLCDAIVLGDILEHLRDPWRTLADLRQRARVEAVCCACIPKVSHHSLLLQQLRGRWDYVDTGLLDRTHLRFFTLQTAIELFRQAGWKPLDARPLVQWPDRTREALELFKPLCPALGVGVDDLVRNLSAFQWVIRAVNRGT